MKKKTTLEEHLTQAFYAFNLAESDFRYAENEYFKAEMAYHSAWQEYNQAFYDYVKFGTIENYEIQHRASETLSFRNKKANEAKINHKLALCRFKKAKRLYEKLKKKHDKQLGEN